MTQDSRPRWHLVQPVLAVGLLCGSRYRLFESVRHGCRRELPVLSALLFG